MINHEISTTFFLYFLRADDVRSEQRGAGVPVPAGDRLLHLVDRRQPGGERSLRVSATALHGGAAAAREHLRLPLRDRAEGHGAGGQDKAHRVFLGTAGELRRTGN